VQSLSLAKVVLYTRKRYVHLLFRFWIKKWEV